MGSLNLIRWALITGEALKITAGLKTQELLKTAEGQIVVVLERTHKSLVSVYLLLDSCLISQGRLSATPDSYRHNADMMFSLYLGEAEKIDRQLVGDWKGTADGILIFVRGVLLV
jgi:hypothetical protein